MRLLLFLIAISFVACSPVSKIRITRALRESEEIYNDHTGFIIYDPQKNKTILEYKADKYFTPASNTKILTLYTCIETLGDSIPALRYVEKDDSLIIWGTGDPSFLNPITYHNQKTYDFLSTTKKPIYFSNSNFYSPRFGPGWAWDDYNDYYSQERSSFPIYGNSFQVFPLPDRILILPDYFNKFLHIGTSREKVELVRQESTNDFVLYPGIKKSFKEFTVPFTCTENLFVGLMNDTLHLKIRLTDLQMPPDAKTLFSVPSDSLYKVMMQQSDNHIAEQLLLLCAGMVSDSLDTEIAIHHMQKNFLRDWPDKIVWKDGSGLSRYNQITPRTVLTAWQKIYAKVPKEKLLPLLATGGKSGTLKNWFLADKPYLFGKTGTISNNHNLSGYLITKKGATLIFAFMNAGYVAPVNEIRKNMQTILNQYYENY